MARAGDRATGRRRATGDGWTRRPRMSGAAGEWSWDDGGRGGHAAGGIAPRGDAPGLTARPGPAVTPAPRARHNGQGGARAEAACRGVGIRRRWPGGWRDRRAVRRSPLRPVSWADLRPQPWPDGRPRAGRGPHARTSCRTPSSRRTMRWPGRALGPGRHGCIASPRTRRAALRHHRRLPWLPFVPGDAERRPAPARALPTCLPTREAVRPACAPRAPRVRPACAGSCSATIRIAAYCLTEECNPSTGCCLMGYLTATRP
jgi:hypothetical protein